MAIYTPSLRVEPRPLPTALLRPARDHRIDVFRGLALLVIAWNHLGWFVPGGGSLFFHWTPATWGLSDAAEVFVFLSGYVYALAYARVWREGGWRAAYRKSALRAWELVVVNSLTFVVVAGLVAWFATALAPESTARIEALAPLLERPMEALRLAAVMFYTIPFFGILSLYVKLLLLAPVLYAALRWRWWAGLGLSLALYGLGQTGLHLGDEYFNTLAWQLLFVVGMALGVTRWRVPRRRELLVLSLVVVVGAAVVIRVMNPLGLRGIGPEWDWLALLRWAEKPTLHPLRLLHFAALAYLVHHVTRPEGAAWSGRALRSVRLAGRHALGVFAFGIVAVYLAVLVGNAVGTGTVGALVLALVVVAASLGWARVLAWKAAPPPGVHGDGR